VVTYSEARGPVLNENRIHDYNKKSELKPKLKALLEHIEGRVTEL
jgi:hypothetical protein